MYTKIQITVAILSLTVIIAAYFHAFPINSGDTDALQKEIAEKLAGVNNSKIAEINPQTRESCSAGGREFFYFDDLENGALGIAAVERGLMGRCRISDIQLKQGVFGNADFNIQYVDDHNAVCYGYSPEPSQIIAEYTDGSLVFEVDEGRFLEVVERPKGVFVDLSFYNVTGGRIALESQNSVWLSIQTAEFFLLYVMIGILLILSIAYICLLQFKKNRRAQTIIYANCL